MPLRPPSPCSAGCGRYVPRGGKCDECKVATEATRASRRERGYGRLWELFHPRFNELLARYGILAVCGATLPQGPRTRDSLCKQQGWLTFASADGSALQFDHEPPLQLYERSDPAKVCDPARIQLLCASCHGRKQARESSRP